MGMFDRVWFWCPKCGRKLEKQSKAGDCVLHDYPCDSVPDSIAADIVGGYIYCPTCEEGFEIKEGARSTPSLYLE